MKLRLWRGVAAWVITSLVWALFCYIVVPPSPIPAIVGICLGAISMTLGLWWGRIPQ